MGVLSSRFWYSLRRVPGAASAQFNFKVVFTCVTGFLVLLASYISLLIVERQTSLDAVSRYNSTWLLSQAATEMARLYGTVAAYAVPGSTLGPDDVQLRLDIVVNRVRMFDDAEVRGLIRSSSSLTEIANDVRDAIAAAQLMLDGLDGPSSVGKLLAHLEPVNGKLVRLASAAHVQSGALAAADQAQLSRLHWIFSGVLVSLVACGFVLIGVLSWHNRLLVTAHDKVNLLVDDLTHTGNRSEEASCRERVSSPV